MASSPLLSSMMMIIILVLLVQVLKGVCRENFEQDFKITWGNDKGKILNNGQLLTLTLDSYSGSGFESSKEYLFGRIDMQIKLVPGNSAGTVTAYYLSSKDDKHDEIDYEFLGNLTGEPYTVHTNIYADGKGEKEQQFHLWFDPTANFHTYSIIWNPQIIIFAIDETPIRQFKNRESGGIPFPKSQAMRLYSSIWNADQWATQGGRIKTDWNQAPFSSTYRNFKANACVRVEGRMSCDPQTSAWMTLRELKGKSLDRLKWVRKNYMIYNYCTDTNRFPQGLPKECNVLD